MRNPRHALAPRLDWNNLETVTWEEFMEPDLLFMQLVGIDPELYTVDLEHELSFEDTLELEDPWDLHIGFVNIDGSWYRIRKKESVC